VFDTSAVGMPCTYYTENDILLYSVGKKWGL
jgi:hypothetical protein